MFFTPREVAVISRFHIQTIYRHIKEGVLRAERVSTGSFRISRADLISYLGGSPDLPPEDHAGPFPRVTALSVEEEREHYAMVHELGHLALHDRERNIHLAHSEPPSSRGHV